ncbi:MAG: zinc ABC transporter substrate-binding protein [Anaerolineales bacterium]|nr:zinc ABC transporter substrate-binding protein [Anaerolineales bacterium]
MAVTAVLLSACAGVFGASSEGLQVVATTSIVGDVISQIGGQHVEVTVLIPAGADPHGFEPTPQDAAALTSADVVVANGLGLEESLQALLDAQGDKVVYASEGVHALEFDEHDHHDEDHDHEHEGEEGHDHDHEHEGEDHDHEHEGEEGHDHDHEHEGEDHDHEHEGEESHDHDHEHEGPDPHAWMNPQNVKVWVDNIADALAEADPAHAADYAANAESYKAELDALDAWIVEQIAAIDEHDRVLVTDHETLGYFADRYDFEMVGALIPSFSTLSEPSAGELAALEAAIAEHGVEALFVGFTVTSSLAERVAADTGVQLVTLYTEALSAADGPAASYMDMMRYNVSAIVQALK